MSTMNNFDGVILLLGQTGVGKSTFINHAAGKEVAKVGQDYDSSTSEVSSFVVAQSTLNPHRIMLVDTPGFNDTLLRDAKILAQIIAWLKKLSGSVNFYGVLYLVQNRQNVKASHESITPGHLCQPSLVKNVCIATVTLKNNVRGKGNFMVESGAQIRRFEQSHQSALNILEGMSQIAPIPLQTFVREMVILYNKLSPSGMEILHDHFSSPGIILLLGQSGVGKSTFINHAAGKEVTKAGQDYDNSTSEVSGFVVAQSTLNPRHIILVDTPGFNHTWLKDVEILAQIITWLKRLSTSVHFYGVLYLVQDSTQNAKTPHESITHHLRQPSLVKNVCIITVAHKNNVRWEWKFTKESGQIRRFEQSQQSALNILEKMSQIAPIPLQTFVREMVILHNQLSPPEILHDRFSTPGMILLLGQSGVGKSTFINDAAGENIATVREDLEDCPLTVSGFDVESPLVTSSRYINVKLVDTPGFNDEWVHDVQVLETIIHWMKEQNRKDGSVKVYGVLYLHDIIRHNPAQIGRPVTPDSLYQPHLVKNVFLATAGWTGKDTPEHLVRREEDLRTKSWSLMSKAGSQILRFEHTQRSAWDIIERMTAAEPTIPIETFVREMESIHKNISPRKHGWLRGFFSFLFDHGI